MAKQQFDSSQNISPRNLKRKSSLKRSMEILEATKLLLSEQGYDKLSLRKIAAITGIHLKTLQHYFPTKEILIKATLEYVQSLYEKKIQEISSHSTDAEKNFKNYINYLVEDIKTIETAGFFYQLWAMAHVDKNTNNIMEQISERDLIILGSAELESKGLVNHHIISGNHYYDEALAEMTMVAEGVRAARMFIKRAEDENIDIPFTKAINTLLDGDIDAEECCRRIVGLN